MAEPAIAVATKRTGSDDVNEDSAEGGPDVGVVRDDGSDGDGNLGDWYATVR
jgi:hypothetical protein